MSPDGAFIWVGLVFDHQGDDWPAVPQGWSATDRNALGRLARLCWGNWICVALQENGAVEIGRDPSGGLPCYYAAGENRWVFGAQARDVAAALDHVPSIDWLQVATQLHRPAMRTQETCLAGLKELLPGHRLALAEGRNDGAQEAFWSPWDHVGRVQADPPPQSLRTVIERVTRSLGRVSGTAMVSLSGGLDSSIVAAALASGLQKPHCLTLASRSGEGDEQGYARAVAAYLGAPLDTWHYDDHPFDPLARASQALPRPAARLFARQADQARSAFAAEVSARAILGGDGGDEVFCYLQSVTPLVDRWLVEGYSAGCRATFEDLSRLTRCSLGRIAVHAARRVLFPRPYRWPQVPDMLTSMVIKAAQAATTHPWLTAPPDALPGKQAHVAGVIRAQNYVDLHVDCDRPYFLPLLAQPVVEHCLTIPTWIWCDGGLNRAHARRAFEGFLPASILTRETKGGVDSFCMSLVETHLSGIRAYLLDGALVRQGIVDTAALETCFALDRRSGSQCHRLLALVDAQGWADAWMAQAGSC